MHPGEPEYPECFSAIARDTQKFWSCSTGGALRLSKLFVCEAAGTDPVEDDQDSQRPRGCVS